jgi:hypothetical protein
LYLEKGLKGRADPSNLLAEDGRLYPESETGNPLREGSRARVEKREWKEALAT